MDVLVIIVSVAEFARLTKNKPMYDYAAALIRPSGISLIPYDFETPTLDSAPQTAENTDCQAPEAPAAESGPPAADNIPPAEDNPFQPADNE
jgi:hypothetical protein